VVAASEKLTPATKTGRDDLSKIPLVTIDGADARDFDDAVYAALDESAGNKGGWNLKVAIADVSHYVTSASIIDREAIKRGNSVYFPDRVVPMLPEALSNELCSLKPLVDRACLVAHMTIDKHGDLQHFKFTRAIMRSVARLTYEQTQAAMDGQTDSITAPLLERVIKPLYSAYDILLKARKKRGTLDLDISERHIKMSPEGFVASIGTRTRLDSHRLIEEMMILANVAAATALQDAGMAGLYRVHDTPSAEKQQSLRDFLKGFDITLAPAKNLRPSDLAAVLEKFVGSDHAPIINEVMLRSQAQAIYSMENIGHFGLALARYAHFTSPIRRYADLIVHRALIRLYKLGDDGLTDDEMARLGDIGEHISKTERRAIDAERDASDRYASLFLASKVGEVFSGRVSGVSRAGLFVRLSDFGADGFVPMNTLPRDFYNHDEAAHALVGSRSGRRFGLADKVTVKLIAADPVVGGLRFQILDGDQDPDSNNNTGANKPFRFQRSGKKTAGSKPKRFHKR
jgi:ribonuclease R